MPEITSSGFLTRNIIEYLTTDKRVRQYRCNTVQNPLAYHDGTQFRPVSITDVADTFSANSEGIYLRNKNVVSVGLKKADDAYKFIGLRPDEKQDGSEQLEFSLESIEVNGKSQIIDLSTKTAISPLAHNLGPLIVHSRRQGTRICLPLTNADEGFKFSLRLHLTGLTVKYISNLDEYWIFNEKGKFRFGLRKPLLLDADGEPLNYETELEHYANLVKHSLTELGGGEYLYTKEPTEAFGQVELPASFLVDADTAYSTTADGEVYYGHATWATARGAATGSGSNTGSAYDGNSISCALAGGKYWIYRAFFYFDASPLSGTITACSEFLYGVGATTHSEAMAMKGTQNDSLAVADYDSFTGNSYGSKTPWSHLGYNEIVFNDTGISDVEAALGGIVKVCNREDPHDFDNSAPVSNANYNGCYFANQAGTDYDPYLSITVAAGPANVKKVSGVAWASVKELTGVAAASVKKVAGVA